MTSSSHRSTIKRIADLCGVSRGTVDRVLNNRSGVNAETAARVRTAARQLGYRPNPVGRALFALRRPIRLGVILSPDYNPFVADLKRGLAQAAKELGPLGVRVDARATRTLAPGEQAALVDAFAAEGIDGLALLPLESPEVVERLRSVIAQGTPVVTFNSDVPEIDRLCFVGQDHVAGGRVAGSLMGLMVRAGPVAVIASSRALLCHVQRVEGFREKLRARYPGVAIVATEQSEDRADLTERHALALCRRFPELRGIYLTGGGAAGLGRALRENGRAGQLRVVAHDFVPDTVALLKERVLDFAIGQDPFAQGYLPVRILHAFLRDGRRPPVRFVPTRIDVRTDDNIDETGYADLLHGATVEETWPAEPTDRASPARVC